MKEFNEPNLNAPRFREKKLGILNKKLFKEFQKEHPEYSKLDYATFKEIIVSFNKELYNAVIDNRNGISLPEGLGYIFIGTCPPSKKKNVDYNKSIKYGVTASHRNWDSDNNLMKIFFTNSKVRYHIPNRQLWRFSPTREFKRLASQVYKEEWMRYIKIDTNKKIASLFNKKKQKDYVQKLGEQVPDNYDEFKM